MNTEELGVKEESVETEDPLLVTIQPGKLDTVDPLLVTIQPGNIGTVDPLLVTIQPGNVFKSFITLTII